ncbi:hypothetical protein AYJ54_45270 [Bradyrhizobium centrolobii]|uniref:Uncharacterized protein n=1 Tax=Bradyrhizobium centrolobii TaxID=1505087 RepID=A0A176Z1Y3_9BRAD|nr:hypothetical protein AYJ54_45270 [Bradyrhizobium centrolobii]
MGLTSSVAAQSRALPKSMPPATAKAETLTGKERLGPKWTDEQRIDNCNVPPDKRGTKPRPILCSNHLTN